MSYTLEEAAVWVICRDHGYEGLGEPLRAYTTEREAKSDAKLISEFSDFGSVKILRVPMKQITVDAASAEAGL